MTMEEFLRSMSDERERPPPRVHDAACDCQDCYFTAIGDEMERFPPLAIRTTRG